jgi:hypothetical protein
MCRVCVCCICCVLKNRTNESPCLLPYIYIDPSTVSFLPFKSILIQFRWCRCSCDARRRLEMSRANLIESLYTVRVYVVAAGVDRYIYIIKKSSLKTGTDGRTDGQIFRLIFFSWRSGLRLTNGSNKFNTEMNWIDVYLCPFKKKQNILSSEKKGNFF